MKRLILACAFALVALPADAQSPDARWQPWLGCWELAADNVREGAPAAARLAENADAAAERAATSPRVCVTPAPGGGARFETTVRGQAALDHTIVPGAAARPINDAECRGIERAEWSADGLRVFTRAELTCTGDPGPRMVSGLSLLAPNGTWLDIQSVSIAARETVRVRRYYRVEDRPAARGPAPGASLGLDDVKEAAAKITPRVLEAALVETNAGLNLSGEELVDLDEAGVPDSVIDLLVALSYPERFVVERESRSARASYVDPFYRDPFMLGWAFGYPVWYDDYYYSPYYYSPFAYSRYGFRPFDVYAGGAVISVVPELPQPTGTGRVVDGQGYTRVRPRPATDVASLPQGSTVVRSGSATTSASAPSPAPSSSSSSSSSGGSTASTSGGYSSGSTSTDTGRTAQPR